jgi:hypothetical protein
MSNSMIILLIVIQSCGMLWAWTHLLHLGASGSSKWSLALFIGCIVLWTILWPVPLVALLLTRNRDV